MVLAPPPPTLSSPHVVSSSLLPPPLLISCDVCLSEEEDAKAAIVPYRGEGEGEDRLCRRCLDDLLSAFPLEAGWEGKRQMHGRRKQTREKKRERTEERMDLIPKNDIKSNQKELF